MSHAYTYEQKEMTERFATPELNAAFISQSANEFIAAVCAHCGVDHVTAVGDMIDHGSMKDEIRVADTRNGCFVIVTWPAKFEVRVEGTHDGLRDGASSRLTDKAGGVRLPYRKVRAA